MAFGRTCASKRNRTAKDNGSIGRSRTTRERVKHSMSIDKSEWERMVSGRLYDPADREIELPVSARKKERT